MGYSSRMSFAAIALFFVCLSSASAQLTVQRRAPGADPMLADSLPAYVRTSAPADPVIARIWEEGMQRSQVAMLAQTLTDSIGARLTASPEMESASRWVMSMYQRWGIPA